MINLDFIDDKIAHNQIIILDGATGTELEKRGVAMNSAAWSAEAVLTSAEIVQAVHEDYIRARSRYYHLQFLLAGKTHAQQGRACSPFSSC